VGDPAYYEGILQAGDPQEGAQAAFDLGDYYFFDIGEHHGTPDQRENAMLYGYNTGAPANCTTDLETLPPQALGG
jgi:uncharacterized protein